MGYALKTIDTFTHIYFPQVSDFLLLGAFKMFVCMYSPLWECGCIYAKPCMCMSELILSFYLVWNILSSLPTSMQANLARLFASGDYVRLFIGSGDLN